jgi:hypothetical protein
MKVSSRWELRVWGRLHLGTVELWFAEQSSTSGSDLLENTAWIGDEGNNKGRYRYSNYGPLLERKDHSARQRHIVGMAVVN